MLVSEIVSRNHMCPPLGGNLLLLPLPLPLPPLLPLPPAAAACRCRHCCRPLPPLLPLPLLPPLHKFRDRVSIHGAAALKAAANVGALDFIPVCK